MTRKYDSKNGRYVTVLSTNGDTAHVRDSLEKLYYIWVGYLQ
jgi:hypothetical protein